MDVEGHWAEEGGKITEAEPDGVCLANLKDFRDEIAKPLLAGYNPMLKTALAAKDWRMKNVISGGKKLTGLGTYRYWCLYWRND